MDRREFIKKATMAAAGAAVASPVSAMINQVSDKKCKVLGRAFLCNDMEEPT